MGMRMAPLAFTPMEQLFRKMITVSVVFHVVALGLATLWGWFYSPPSYIFWF